MTGEACLVAGSNAEEPFVGMSRYGKVIGGTRVHAPFRSGKRGDGFAQGSVCRFSVVCGGKRQFSANLGGTRVFPWCRERVAAATLSILR